MRASARRAVSPPPAASGRTAPAAALATGALAGCLLVASAIPVTARAASADPAANYPSKPIRMMGGGPGSTADYLSRFVGQRLTERWGQSVVVDSRSGAGGLIATDITAKAPPDGYTLMMGHAGTHVSVVGLYKSLPYDPIRDFAPVTQVSRGVTVLVVPVATPVNTAQEFVAYARQRGNLSYSSAGPGTASHLTGELFNQITGLKLLHVPYKGAGVALTAVLGNEVNFSFLSPITAHTQMRAGKVKGLVVSGKTRFPGLPEVPSAPEAGLPGMEAILWFGIFAPAKTPRPIVDKLNAAVTEMLRQPEVKEAILKQGAEVWPTTPEELGAFVKAEIPRWTRIIRDAGITAN